MGVAALALIPLVYLVTRASEAGGGQVAAILLRERTFALIGRSLAFAATVTAGCVVIGVGLAVLVARTDVPGRRLLAALAPLPLAVPSYVAAFAWISWLPGVSGFRGAVLVLTLCCYPFVYLPVLAVLRQSDGGAEEVARTLGRGPWSALRAVTLPRVIPAASAGGLLVALYALSDFGAVSILRYDVFTRVIHTSYSASFDRTPAAVLGLLLVLITVLLAVGERLARRREVASVGGGSARPPARLPLGRARIAASLAAYAVLGLALLVPLTALLFWFATGLSSGLEWDRLLPALGATAWFAGLGAVAATIAAIPVGVLAARHRGRLATGVEQAIWAAHALPGLVVGLAIVFLGIRVLPGLYQRTPLLVLAYVVLFLPAAVASVRASVALSSPRIEEVARSLGARPSEVLRRVTLPLAAPGIGAGAALVLLTAMKELPATLLLRPTGADTLATRLWSHTGVGAYAAAAPYALLLVLLAVLPTIALMRATGAWGEANRGAAEGAGQEVGA